MLIFNRWKIGFILGISLLGILFALPNLFSESSLAKWPGFLPKNQVNLGLDLQGGSYLLLGADFPKYLSEQLISRQDDIRNVLFGRNMEGGRIAYRGLRTEKETIFVNITNSADIPEALKRIRSLSKPVNAGGFGGGAQELDIKEDNGRISVNFTDKAKDAMRLRVLEQSIAVVRKRIDSLGTREASIQRQGRERIVVQVPGANDPGEIKEILLQTAKMSFHDVDTSVTVDEALGGRVPPGAMVLPYDEGSNLAGNYIVVKQRALIPGERLKTAYQSFDSRTNEVVIAFEFDSVGALKFAEHTRKNVKRPFAIVIDNEVLTAPVIQSPILTGSGQISGSFTVESANQLAIMLRSGALPVDLNIEAENTVGPELGKDSIESGRIAAIIGFIAVMVYITITYGLFGIFANLALILNLVLVMGALSLLGATLTLPGIAGIVLTIGMAVDANVLVFERIREEINLGKSPINSVDAGYQKAASTIFDANFTTLIAASILFFLGSGPIRGFSVTLGIGIVTSVFTAFVVTRLMISVWLRQRRPKAIPI